MKMKSKFLVFLILSSNLAFASSDNYLAYYSNINKAELHINKIEFDSALIVYETTFKKYSNHFYKDLHNACLCYIKLNKFDEAERIAEELILHGYELNNFNSNSAFGLLIKNPVWKLLLNNYSILHNKYLETLNNDYRKNLYTMFIKDQKAASSKNMIYQDSVFYYQAIELENMFNKYGFPSCMVNKDTLNTKVIMIIRHYFGLVNRAKSNPEMLKRDCYLLMDFNKIQLSQLLEKGLYAGLVLPQTYLGMVSLWDNSNKYGNLSILVDFNTIQTSLHLDLTSDKIKEVNKNRILIGLPQIDLSNPYDLKTTWYSEFPFEEIKKALSTCDTCSDKDYADIAFEIGMKVKDSFKINPLLDGFILTDNSNINGVYYKGMYQYQKNKNLKK